jgi:hypothetical protein
VLIAILIINTIIIVINIFILRKVSGGPNNGKLVRLFSKPHKRVLYSHLSRCFINKSLLNATEFDDEDLERQESEEMKIFKLNQKIIQSREFNLDEENQLDEV